MNKYPESGKLLLVRDESQKLGEFISWLKGRFTLASWERNDNLETCEALPDILLPCYDYMGDRGTQKLLAEYFRIDLDKIEEERRQMLKTLQEALPPPGSQF